MLYLLNILFHLFFYHSKSPEMKITPFASRLTSEKTIKPFKILIVDDDVSVVKMVEKILFNKYYVLLSATGGAEAFEKAKEWQPDIILMDIVMPDMDGYQACELLRDHYKTYNIPVIFLSGYDKPEEVVKGFEVGAVDYVTKPFYAGELQARVKTHLDLKRSKEELKEVHQLKARFFSLITNDIRDSLIGVKGVANFLVQDIEENNTEEIIKLAKILQSDSEQLYDLLEDLIEWAVIESERFEMATVSIDVRKTMNEVLHLVKKPIFQKDIKIEMLIEENLHFHCDPEMFVSALHRLLMNAVKYSQPGGKVTLEVSTDPKNVIVAVKDEGVGMDQDVVDNIFRIDTPHPKTTGTANETGSGLGLIICKSLIEKWGGRIWIESKKHRGVKVFFTIPYEK